MPRLTRTPEAMLDAAHIWRYIAENNLDAAERWLLNIDQKMRLLAEFPMAGAARDELGPSMRSFPVGRYLIFYRPIQNGIEVIRVLYGARHLREVFKRP